MVVFLSFIFILTEQIKQLLYKNTKHNRQLSAIRQTNREESGPRKPYMIHSTDQLDFPSSSVLSAERLKSDMKRVRSSGQQQHSGSHCVQPRLVKSKLTSCCYRRDLRALCLLFNFLPPPWGGFQSISPSILRGLTRGHQRCLVIIKHYRCGLPSFIYLFSFIFFPFLPHNMFLYVGSMRSVLLFMHSITRELFCPEKQTDRSLAQCLHEICCAAFCRLLPPPPPHHHLHPPAASLRQLYLFVHFFFLPVAAMVGCCQESQFVTLVLLLVLHLHLTPSPFLLLLLLFLSVPAWLLHPSSLIITQEVCRVHSGVFLPPDIWTPFHSAVPYQGQPGLLLSTLKVCTRIDYMSVWMSALCWSNLT